MDDAGPDLGLDLGEPPPRRDAGAYRVLARKYRPQTFESLIGQEALVRTLSNAFARNRIAHAFMLTGVRGVGKTTTARIIARALNCVGPDGTGSAPTITPCGVCEPCRSIAESRAVDVLEMDAASRTGIDDIREIVDSVRYAPAAVRFKVYIIDEVHMLSKAAFNGLLKTLEEPPPHVKFIFATTEIRKVPVTVLSRCQRFDLRRIPAATLVDHLQQICTAEGVAAGAEALGLIARAAEGSVRDALSLLDQAIAHSDETGGALAAEPVRRMLGLADRSRVIDLFEGVMRGRIAEVLAELRAQYDEGAEPLVVVQDLLDYTHFLTRLKLAPATAADGAATEAEVTRGIALAEGLPVSALARAWQILLKGVTEVREAPHPIQAAEMLLVRLAYAADLPPADALVRRLKDEAGAATAAAPGQSSGTPPPRPRAEAPALGPAPAPSRARAGAVSLPAAAPPDPVADGPPRLHSLEEIAALAGEHRDALLKVQIERFLRLVRLEPGRLEVALSNAAPRTLASTLADRLREWTGTRWIVTVVNGGGGETLAERAAQQRQAALDAVMTDPTLQAVLARFPDAVIRDIREPAPPVATDTELTGDDEAGDPADDTDTDNG